MWLPLFLLAAVQTGATGKVPSVPNFDPRQQFVVYDPEYRSHIAARKDRLESLQSQLYAKARHGSSACSREILVEAHWLAYYTCDYAAIDRQLDKLEAIVKDPGKASDEKLQASDGSYAPCHNAWFYKLDRTCDRLTVMSESKLGKQRRLAFLDRINSPELLLGYLNSKLVSDIPKTGVDNSFELNLGGTDLLRLINGHLPSGYRFHPGLRKTVEAWVNQTWQDPVTGCFGAWYRTDKGIVKTVDLSSTFHVCDYMDGHISRWPQLISTIMAVKEGAWPRGWLQQGKPSNHHNFDIASLFHKGWSEMTNRQRAQAKVELQKMLDHCLHETLNADGSFKQEDMATVGESFEFPVFLLAELGYFHASNRFWTDQKFPESHGLAQLISAKIHAQHLEDPESEIVLYLLSTAD